MKKYSVLSTHYKSKNKTSLEFNISAMVRNYFIARVVIAKLHQNNMDKSAVYFSGIIRGYDDWFAALGITQDVFNSVMEKSIDRTKARIDAEIIFQGVLKDAKENKVIVSPSMRDILDINKESGS